MDLMKKEFKISTIEKTKDKKKQEMSKTGVRNDAVRMLRYNYCLVEVKTMV